MLRVTPGVAVEPAQPRPDAPSVSQDPHDLVGRTVEEVERELILSTLAHHGGNRTHAAGALGISLRTLRNKIQAYAALGIAVPEPQARNSAEGSGCR